MLLETRGLSGSGKPIGIDLTLRRGEVVGVAGLLGSGRSSLARVLAGVQPMASGEIRIKGKVVSITKDNVEEYYKTNIESQPTLDWSDLWGRVVGQIRT